MRLLVWLAVAITFAVLSSAGALAASAKSGPAVLTVTGKITDPNRGAMDPFMDGFFNYHEKVFDSAYAFDRASLAGLPQVTVSANVEGWPAAIEASGPRLADVLDAAGVPHEAAVTLFALDGYGAMISASERAEHDWVLAISVNGAPLDVGGRGPAWLVYDTGDGAATADAEAKWVWSAFLIEAE